MRTITNVFLLNLAISDILLGVLCMPVTLVGTLLRHFIFGEYFCKLIQFSQAASVAVSSWTLVAISCERYYAICHPLRSRRWQTRSHAYKIIACIWFGSMLCMTPIALFSQLMPTSRQGYRKCRENWPSFALPYERPYNIFLDLVLLVLPLLILSVAYILITRTLYVRMRIEKAMIFGGSCNGKYNSDEMYTTLQRKYPNYGAGSKGSYLSAKTTTTTTTSSSSTTTVASATSTSTTTSRFKLNLSLRRHGNAATNVHIKHNGNGGGVGVGPGTGTGTGTLGHVGTMGGMRSLYMHNKVNLDSNIRETDIFQQQQSHSQKPYHHQNHLPAHHQRIYHQQPHQQQQQNHCHNYHQHQLLQQHNDDDQDQHQTLPQHAFNKLCCGRNLLDIK